MAAKKNEIDLEADYDVKLAKSFKLGRTTLSPRNKVTVKGSILVTMQSEGVVLEFSKIEASEAVEPVAGGDNG